VNKVSLQTVKCEKLVSNYKYLRGTCSLDHQVSNFTLTQTTQLIPEDSDCNCNFCLRFMVILALTMKSFIIWDVTPCSLVEVYQTIQCHVPEDVIISVTENQFMDDRRSFCMLIFSNIK
jgi:hypothetical protein